MGLARLSGLCPCPGTNFGPSRPCRDWYGEVALQYKDILERGHRQLGDGDGVAVFDVDHNKPYNKSAMLERAKEISAKYSYLDEGEHRGPKPMPGSWGGPTPPIRREPQDK